MECLRTAARCGIVRVSFPEDRTRTACMPDTTAWIGFALNALGMVLTP